MLRAFGTGAAAKRVGYLCEKLWPDATDLIQGCLDFRTRGNTKLDPRVPTKGRLLTRWGLWENTPIRAEGHS
jgi:predicted transcriptional regulator of viral defense system